MKAIFFAIISFLTVSCAVSQDLKYDRHVMKSRMAYNFREMKELKSPSYIRIMGDTIITDQAMFIAKSRSYDGHNHSKWSNPYFMFDYLERDHIAHLYKKKKDEEHPTLMVTYTIEGYPIPLDTVEKYMGDTYWTSFKEYHTKRIDKENKID